MSRRTASLLSWVYLACVVAALLLLGWNIVFAITDPSSGAGPRIASNVLAGFGLAAGYFTTKRIAREAQGTTGDADSRAGESTTDANGHPAIGLLAGPADAPAGSPAAEPKP